jgi:glyoxylase-like metal-dependent hydrolase (beta-lactamase superfamily II)
LEILNTHGHPDHAYADAAVKRATSAAVSIHRLDAYRLGQQEDPVTADRLFDEGDESALADLRITILHTPGHTEGSVCFYAPAERALFSGDTLFNAGLGRTDLPGGDARALVASLHRLSTLPPDTVVYPGHGPSTTIGAERGWIEPLTAEGLLA